MTNTGKDFYKKLDSDKIKIKWNKKSIEMNLFLSFLKIDFIQSKDHLGYCTGWTLYENEEYKLRITGCKINGKEYLDNIRYGIKLQNQYNNYVNPFYLFEIMNLEGKKFFINYYMDDILLLIDKQKKVILNLKAKLDSENNVLTEYDREKELLLSVAQQDVEPKV